MDRKPFVAPHLCVLCFVPLILARASGTGGLAAGLWRPGLREIGEPARKAMILDLSAAHARGRSVGVYYLVRGLAVFPASLVGGWLWTLDPRWPFYAAFAVGVAACMVHALWGPSSRLVSA